MNEADWAVPCAYEIVTSVTGYRGQTFDDVNSCVANVILRHAEPEIARRAKELAEKMVRKEIGVSYEGREPQRGDDVCAIIRGRYDGPITPRSTDTTHPDVRLLTNTGFINVRATCELRLIPPAAEVNKSQTEGYMDIIVGEASKE